MRLCISMHEEYERKIYVIEEDIGTAISNIKFCYTKIVQSETVDLS